MARDVLERGVFAHLAVETSHGPHLTPVVFVLEGGRLWVTTSRRSVKARAWRRDPRVAGLVSADGVAVIFRGRARTYDALDPLSWPAAALGGPGLVKAATRFSLKNARFFAGYAVDARRVPLAWSPPGRVFVRIDLTAGHVLDPAGPIDSWGEWPAGRLPRLTCAEPLPGARGLDLRAPASVRSAVGRRGRGALAMLGGGELSVLPADWTRVARQGAYHASVPRASLALARPGARDLVALTVDRPSTWRAADMAGMLLQGRGEIFLGAAAPGLEAGPALIRLRPTRAVWWEGWRAGTVVEGSTRRRAGR